MSIKILLADDSITIQKVIGIIFGGDEYSLTVVDNGKAAVEKALETAPDVLLIDALMPGMSGYDVCEQIRDIPALAAKPILLLTGSFEPFDETKAKSCGADDFLAKPFESQQIISKVTELYELGASRAFSAVPAEEQLPEEPPALPEEPVSFAEAAPAAQPQDIWEAFTPAEPAIEAAEPFFATEEEPAALSAQESVASLWAPVDERDYVFEEQAAAETAPTEESSFGDISLDEPVMAAVEAEETVGPVEAFESDLAIEPAVAVEPPGAAEPAAIPPETPAAAPEAAAALPANLSEEQIRAAIAGLSRDVIERVVWEVVPDLAEAMIKEAIRKIRDGQ